MTDRLDGQVTWSDLGLWSGKTCPEHSQATMSKIVRPKTPFEFCAYPVLKEALEKTNYNQTELAQSLGTSQFTVSAWARGDRDVTVRLLLALEDLTGMTFRELFGDCEGRK